MNDISKDKDYQEFFTCISSNIAAYRFSVSWILRFIVAAFLLQVANPKLGLATTGLGNQQSNRYQQWYEQADNDRPQVVIAKRKDEFLRQPE